MKLPSLRRVEWPILGLLAAVAAVRIAGTDAAEGPGSAEHTAPTTAAAPPASRGTTDSLDAPEGAGTQPLIRPKNDPLPGTITAANPFRFERRPTEVRFAVEGDARGRAPAARRPPFPDLHVHGIVGPPWEAIVSGLPGRRQSTLIRAGDEWGELRVEAITRNAVRFANRDTTWTLDFRPGG